MMCLFIAVEVELERLSSEDAGADPECAKEMHQLSCWDMKSEDLIKPSVDEVVGVQKCEAPKWQVPWLSMSLMI